MSFNSLGEENYHEGYGLDDLEANDEAFWLLIAEDNEDALIVNLKDDNCRVYYFNAEDVDATVQVAPNFAHRLYLLGYWKRLQDENSGIDGEAPEWREVVNTFQAKLNVLAPGISAKAWNFNRYPYTHLESS